MSRGGYINDKYFGTEQEYFAEWVRITDKLMEMYPWLTVSGFSPGVSCYRKGDTYCHETFNIPEWAVFCMIGEPPALRPPVEDKWKKVEAKMAGFFAGAMNASNAREKNDTRETWRTKMESRLAKVSDGKSIQEILFTVPDAPAPRD